MFFFFCVLRGLEHAHHVGPDSHLQALLAVVSTLVVVAQSPQNKKGEEATPKRKAVMFAWLMSKLKMDTRCNCHTF